MRQTRRRNKDGSVTAYLALAHNERVNGVSSTRVLLNFGREDLLAPYALRRLVSSLTRYLGDPDPYADDPGAGGLSVTGSRSLGGVWLLDALWHELGIDTALREVLGRRRFTTDVERVLFALVSNRALDPCSKLAAAEVQEQVFFSVANLLNLEVDLILFDTTST